MGSEIYKSTLTTCFLALNGNSTNQSFFNKAFFASSYLLTPPL